MVVMLPAKDGSFITDFGHPPLRIGLSLIRRKVQVDLPNAAHLYSEGFQRGFGDHGQFVAVATAPCQDVFHRSFLVISIRPVEMAGVPIHHRFGLFQVRLRFGGDVFGKGGQVFQRKVVQAVGR